MNVSAIIVTRGDTDLTEILDSLPGEWEAIVWDNSGYLRRWNNNHAAIDDVPVPDFSVYGRYAAIEYASHDLIYVQDDDVIVSDPQAIVDRWVYLTDESDSDETYWPDSLVVCNMPPEFRHDFYRNHALVGFGAAFHRDAPAKAFGTPGVFWRTMVAAQGPPGHRGEATDEFTNRTCDVLFTALTPRVLVDVPVRNLPWATGEHRMYRQEGHQGERQRMLDLALKVRDA